MKRHSLTYLIALFCASFILIACSGLIAGDTDATPVVSVIGRLRPWTDDTPIDGRKIALCRSQGDPRDGICDLLEVTAETDRQGRFQIYDVPAGTYFLIYDSGLSDFDEAMAQWGGKTLHFGDREWLSGLLGVDLTDDGFEYRVPEGIPISAGVDWLSSYCLLTLLVGESPFIIAHDLDSASHDRELHCALVNVLPGQTTKVDVQVLYYGQE